MVEGLRQLLAQLLEAHVTTLPDEASRESLSRIVAALVQGHLHARPLASRQDYALDTGSCSFEMINYVNLSLPILKVLRLSHGESDK